MKSSPVVLFIMLYKVAPAFDEIIAVSIHKIAIE